MDVLASGPERPPRTRRGPTAFLRSRSLSGRGRSRRARWTVAAAGVLLSLGVVASLRSAVGPVEAPSAPRSAAVPTPPGLAAGLPGPPYDRLPGRTPIPRPTRLPGGERVAGSLPAVGPIGERTATASAQLVLGRYCRRPDRYALAVEDGTGGGWRRSRALAVRVDRSSDPPWVVLELTWTGRAYAWSGRQVQLSNC
ncbi:MAG TPA: hypothetical protein VI357_16900 [Mycobacteriales bacterium]